MPSFMRGARPSPRHKLLAAVPHRVTKAPPPQFAVVPSKLSPWGNQQYGDCVTAEEAFAKAWWSVFCGLPETFVPESEVIRWAGRHGFLNGAMLTDVMDAMARDGLNADGTNYKDGPYTGVDYTNELVLQSALTQGPVKIAIDANALPSGAGNQQGWFSTRGDRYRNTDHCVGLGGYGRADYLYDALKVLLPSGLSPSTPGYLLFTWSTLGFVTHEWLLGTCTESWDRNPTTQGQSPAPVPPVPPTPTPVPPIPAKQFVTVPPFSQHIGTFGGTVNYPGGTFEVKPAAGEGGTGACLSGPDVGSIHWVRLFFDLGKLGRDAGPAGEVVVQAGLLLYGDVRSGNWAAVASDATALVEAAKSLNNDAVRQDVRNLLADLGVAA